MIASISIKQMVESLDEDREATFIDTWHERPVLHEHVSKGYSHRNNRLAALSEMAEVFDTSSRANL